MLTATVTFRCCIDAASLETTSRVWTLSHKNPFGLFSWHDGELKEQNLTTAFQRQQKRREPSRLSIAVPPHPPLHFHSSSFSSWFTERKQILFCAAFIFNKSVLLPIKVHEETWVLVHEAQKESRRRRRTGSWVLLRTGSGPASSWRQH